MNTECQIFRHKPNLNRPDYCSLQVVAKVREWLVFIELGPVEQPPSPGEDAGDRVGGRFFAFLSTVFGGSSVGNLSFECAAGLTSTLVISRREPKPCATISLWTL